MNPLPRLIAALVLALGTFAAYAFWYNLVGNQSAEAASLSSQITAKTAVATRAAAARAALAQLASDESEVNTYFISNDLIVSFLEDLQSWGTAQGSTVKILSVSATGNTSAPALQVALSVTGSFAAVMNTVGRIEYAPYDIRTTSLTVSSQGTTGKSTTWRADMTLWVGSVAGTSVSATSTATVSTPVAPASSAASVQGASNKPILR